MHKKRTYLDWAAAAPVSKAAARASARANGVFGNPSSPHREGRAAREILEDARVRIARLGGVKQDAVIFTAGATEANALAILGRVHAFIDSGRGASSMHALYLSSAHASTRGAMEQLRHMGVDVEPLVLSNGAIDLTALAGQLRPETVFVAIEAVCGETGTRFDTRGVRAKIGEKIHLHVDASQLPLVESFQLTRIAADTLTLDAQKVGGVRGIGALLAPRQVKLSPLMLGGGQERGLRPGTESAGLASAFAAALEDAQEGCASFRVRAQGMRERLLSQMPDSIDNGGKDGASHIVNVSLPGRDTDYLAALVDEAGFAISTRSACATDEEGSTAVLAMTGDAARAASTLRISWGPSTSVRELDHFADALVRAVRFVDANAV